jgi:hypothetical protein
MTLKWRGLINTISRFGSRALWGMDRCDLAQFSSWFYSHGGKLSFHSNTPFNRRHLLVVNLFIVKKTATALLNDSCRKLGNVPCNRTKRHNDWDFPGMQFLSLWRAFLSISIEFCHSIKHSKCLWKPVAKKPVTSNETGIWGLWMNHRMTRMNNMTS